MFPFPSLPWFELARFQRNRLSRAALVAVAIVPLFYGVLYVLANWSPTGHLNRVTAAVVNLDQPVTTTTSSGAKQVVPLGRSLAGELTGSTSKQNFGWVLTDAGDAASGLTDGTYSAVVTIPKNFSAAATSTGDADGTQARQALLSVRTNDAQNYLAGTVGAATTAALNSQVTATYLSNVYIGFTDLHTQIGQAAKGASDLADGAGTLSAGAAKTHQGAVQLASGLDTLAGRTSGLPAQTARLNAGAQQVAAGADRLAAGTSQLNAGLQPVRRALKDLPAQSRQLAAGAARITQVTGPLATGAGQLATGADTVSNGLNQYSANAKALAAKCTASGASAEYCTQLTQLVAGVAPLATAAGAVQGGADQLSAGATKLNTGAKQLRGGTARLAAAAPRLVAGIKQGTDAVSQLNRGAQTLAGGAGRVADGTAQLAAVAPQLSQGIAEAASGADQLSTGTGQVAAGAAKLDSGSTKLADGLAEGVQKIPSYSPAERQNLSKVAATPVLGNIQRLNAVVSNGAGLAPYFMSLALWVGAMAIFMLLRALSVRALASTASSWRVAMSGYLPGAVLSVVQAVLLVAVLEFVVGVDAARLPVLTLFAVLVGLTFAAINQALIATFGGAGRFLALIFVSLQLSSAGGTYPIQTAPAFFQAVHDLLPMSYAVQGIRECIAGGGGPITIDVVVLLLWLALGWLVTVIAAHRQRTWTISRLHASSVV
jgi:putative membrane protein